MKRNIQFILFAFFALCLSQAAAQKRPYSGTINIEPVRFEQHGDFLHIEMNLTKQGFPESYKEPLRKLHASYPNFRKSLLKGGMSFWPMSVHSPYRLKKTRT